MHQKTKGIAFSLEEVMRFSEEVITINVPYPSSLKYNSDILKNFTWSFGNAKFKLTDIPLLETMDLAGKIRL